MVTAHKIPNDSLFMEPAVSSMHVPHSLTERTKFTLPQRFCSVLTSAKCIRSFFAFLSVVTHVLVRIQKHEYDHHDVIWRPAHDESNYNHHGNPHRFHLGTMYYPTSVYFGGYVLTSCLHLSLEHLLAFCKNNTKTLGSTWELFPCLQDAFDTSPYNARTRVASEY